MSAPLLASHALEDLRQRFIDRCRDRISVMHRLIGASPLVDDTVAVLEIRRLAHQMAGSGGVFRAPEISKAADRLELACSNSAVSRDKLVSLVRDLDQVVHAC